MSDKGSLIVDLTEVNKNNIEVGSKAANLGELIQNKFSVPDGFVIKKVAYSKFLNQNNLVELIQKSLTKIDYNSYETIRNCAASIQNSIERSALPSELIDEIKLIYSRYRSYNVAVRSSATAEDLPMASFAGQYETYLNLKNIDQVLHHIKKVYASVWASRAIIYRQKNQIPHNSVELAVIIQKMITDKSAGVLFTTNPITGNRSELMIESNFGLGGSIVSGNISPDQYIIKRYGQGRKENYEIISRRIGKKELILRPKPLDNQAGTEYVRLTGLEARESSLTSHQINQLAKLGTQIEQHFGGIPQDIEWAVDKENRIYILQTRPITSLKPKIPSDNVLWSRGYSDDYWNDPVTPLFFDILGDQITKVVNIELNSIMGYQKMDRNLLKLYNGHVYFNLNVLKKKVENEIPKLLRNDDLLNYFPEGSGSFGKRTIKNLPFHLFKRVLAEIRIMLHDPDGSISKTASKYEEWGKSVFDPYCKKFDIKLKELSKTNNLNELIELAEDLDKTMIAHFRLIRYGIPVHNIGMNLMLQYLLIRFLGKEASSRFYPVLISNLQHKLTETNDEIHKLASIILKSSRLKSLFFEFKSEDLYDRISSETEADIQEFFTAFQEFLNLYGDRGFSREAYYPRWNEEPRYVFDILKTLIAGKKHGFEEIKAKNLIFGEKTEQYIESKIRFQRFGLLKWKLFSKILDYSRTYIIFRENQRFNVDKWFTRNRKIYLEIGRILNQNGILQEPSDIFFLHKKEIKKIVLETLDFDISSLITRRKDEFFKYENTIPPKFIQGSQEFDDITPIAKDRHSFQGIPASKGILTGKIRILEKIDEIPSVQPGEIIVVPKTDPGWTPIFSKIGGLITETGGILSHGAVVSREYGIPAVTNISNGCRIFKTGQVVTINGYDGLVMIKK